MGAGATLVPNTAEVFGLSDARGCDYMTVRRYEELITGGAGDFLFYRDAPRFPEAFAFLNVKYVLTSEPALVNSELFELVYSDEIFIYRYKECRDRALVVFDYQVEHDPAAVLSRVRSGTFEPTDLLLLEEEPEKMATNGAVANPDSFVRITFYQPDEVGIDASLSRPGFLLLLDTYFPGWTATVNGRAVRIYRADYNFRAVSFSRTTRSTSWPCAIAGFRGPNRRNSLPSNSGLSDAAQRIACPQKRWW